MMSELLNPSDQDGGMGGVLGFRIQLDSTSFVPSELLRTWSCSVSSAGGPGPLWGPSAHPWWSLRGVGSM